MSTLTLPERSGPVTPMWTSNIQRIVQPVAASAIIFTGTVRERFSAVKTAYSGWMRRKTMKRNAEVLEAAKRLEAYKIKMLKGNPHLAADIETVLRYVRKTMEEDDERI